MTWLPGDGGRDRALLRATNSRARERRRRESGYGERWEAERRRLIDRAFKLRADPNATDKQMEAVLAEIRAFDRLRPPRS